MAERTISLKDRLAARSHCTIQCVLAQHSTVWQVL